ncbi:E3 ubiquitin/ISG15 ligase TRIM25-like [Mixophyes fleayi]|uniref:E3 ubiquitin/ISG15 ligase TRIM25-like n=1 Tax=Mixophyes fleayi TaxID=3061075 RepID=UPI003F4DCBE9
MASAYLREELKCPICWNIYTDSVNLTCGHNYCRDCIKKALDAEVGSTVYTCPKCRVQFPQRPLLQRNITLCNIVDYIKSTQLAQEETGIFCTYCIHSLVPAIKSCAMCEASLCDDHVRVHSQSADHLLMEPSASPGNRKCSVHRKFLEYYCTEDATCICVSCRLDGDHVGHKVDLLIDTAEKKVEKLRNVLQKLTTKREETERRVQSLQERKRKGEGKAADATATVSTQFRDIRRQLDDLEKRVLSEISRQEESVSLSVSDLIQQLEIKKDELSRKMRHIEELCNMSDPVTVLQEPDTGDLCDTEDRERHDDQVHGVGDLDVGLILEILHTGLADLITRVKKNNINMPGASDILFDENTAGNNIHISDHFKKISWTQHKCNRPETPERFQYNQILSLQRFSTGQHYWEVESSKLGDWRIGVCYPTVDRRGDLSWIGENNKSWCLRRCCDKYTVRHDGKLTELLLIPASHRFRITLDYEAGQLSFYSLCDPIRHLHTFTATFTEPLHAAFYVWEGLPGGRCSVTISR